MKKVIAILLLCSMPLFADFNFGNETYTSADAKGLIVNSLGDKPTLSTFGNLGTNDFIPENAVKNSLAMDGFTRAYDYNPTANNTFGVYNQPLPAGGALHEIDFAGLDGDPRTVQKTYVLQSEWDAYSAQSQDTRINANVGAISATNSALGVTNDHVTELYTGLANENVARAAGDAQLQGEVNTANSRIDATNSQVGSLASGLHSANETKVIADLNVRLVDGKRYSVSAFDMYDGAHGHNFALGARITYKLGKSYEERMIEQQSKQITALQEALRQLQRAVN